MAFLVGSDKSYYLGTGSAAMIEKDYVGHDFSFAQEKNYRYCNYLFLTLYVVDVFKRFIALFSKIL